MQIKAIKGVKDILPDHVHVWQHIEQTAREVFSWFGFAEIKIPIIEKTELFIKSIGDTTDIVEKEMYSFEDKGGERITLRPEGTASVVRAFVEHKLHTKFPVTKLYYSGPMFRCERPQAGRYRQFYQIGAEAFGSQNPLIDAEVTSMLIEYLTQLDIKGTEVQVNTLGCKNCRHKYLDAIKRFIGNNLDTLCDDCNRRYKKNPLRILDCKVEECTEVVAHAPFSQDHICYECKTHHENYLLLLTQANVPYTRNHRLVRGLDYYTRTAFEIVDTRLGAQSAVAGGGRYDNLVESFGGPPTPAVGFAIGLERLVSLVGADMATYVPGSCKGFFITLGEEPYNKSFEISCLLRKKGISIEQSYEQGSMKSQMRKANRYNARYVLIYGEDELTAGEVVVKDMSDGTQKSVPLSKVAAYIKQTFDPK